MVKNVITNRFLGIGVFLCVVLLSCGSDKDFGDDGRNSYLDTKLKCEELFSGKSKGTQRALAKTSIGLPVAFSARPFYLGTPNVAEVDISQGSCATPDGESVRPEPFGDHSVELEFFVARLSSVETVEYRFECYEVSFTNLTPNTPRINGFVQRFEKHFDKAGEYGYLVDFVDIDTKMEYQRAVEANHFDKMSNLLEDSAAYSAQFVMFGYIGEESVEFHAWTEVSVGDYNNCDPGELYQVPL